VSLTRRERKNIGNNIDLAGDGEVVLIAVATALIDIVVELEVEETPTLGGSSTRSGIDGSVLSSDVSGSPIQALLAAGTSGSEAAVQAEVTLSGANSVSRPHNDLLGASARDSNDRSRLSARSGLDHTPVQVTRTAQVRANHLDETVNRVEQIGQRIGQVEGVTSTGQDTQILLTAEVLEEEVDRVRLEELVLRGSDNVSRLGSVDVVEDDGVNEVDHGFEFRLVHVAHDVFVPVVTEGPSPTAERTVHVVEVRLHVEDRHDDRSKGFNTLVDTSGQPSGPTSLGCTRDDERLDTRNVESVSELLNGVHRTDGGFGLRELQQPLRRSVSVVHELLPRVGDDAIFSAELLGRIVGESKGLVGNLLEMDSNSVADTAQVINDVVDSCGDGITNVAVVHVEESDVVRHVVGNANSQSMSPDRAG
jgi:hypothetical protein